jgi:phosphatidyl-myo-inositol dimannoside synthase
LAHTSRELKWMTKRALRGAAGLVANSQNTRTLLTRDWGVPAERVHVLHPGVDTTKFVPAEQIVEVRKRLGWENRRVILTVGALQKRKGQDTLIQALPLLLKKFPELLYSIAGEGWERAYLDQLVSEHNLHSWVQFRGTPNDRELLDCYQQCQLFALPNRQVGWDFEGFGIVLLEAQACGQPLLTGDSGGTIETLNPGSTGVVVDCTQPE